MTRPSIFMLFAIVFGLFFVAGPSTIAAQNQPTPAVTEKNETQDGGEPTSADRASIRVSVRWAKRIALKRIPGRIVGWEVEKEDGRVQYEFKIVARNGNRYEVEVDAITGKIIEAEPESNG